MKEDNLCKDKWKKGWTTQKPPDFSVSELRASWEQSDDRKTTKSSGDQQTLINVK